MYKTKLQEVCHQRRWGLPKYSAMKDGPEHTPSFKASVSVNGLTFSSPGTFSSSKEAQNQAAMLAFNSFSSAPPGSSTPTGECNIKGKTGAEEPQDVQLPADSSVIINDMDCLSKSQLQNYARRNNLDPPIFTRKTEGPPHATRFKATVIVDGQSFESPTFFNTIKEAEQAAAKVALMSLSVDIFEKGDSGPFKSILLELTQKAGSKPTYKTIQSGSPHMLTFFSTVEVEGEEFHGKPGKSKKQAEQDAAKVAYLALKECGFHMNAAFSSCHFTENKGVQSIHNADIVKSKLSLKHEDEPKELDLNKILPANVKVSNKPYNPSFPRPPEANLISNTSLSYSESVSNSSPKSSPFSQFDRSCLSISESIKTKSPETSSYLLCNRFKVYTCFPNIAFSEGIIVLPISDNKWVAVSLEFPK